MRDLVEVLDNLVWSSSLGVLCLYWGTHKQSLRRSCYRKSRYEVLDAE